MRRLLKLVDSQYRGMMLRNENNMPRQNYKKILLIHSLINE